jgi:hypothetical protein
VPAINMSLHVPEEMTTPPEGNSGILPQGKIPRVVWMMTPGDWFRVPRTLYRREVSQPRFDTALRPTPAARS